MPRKGPIPRREVLPDPIYGSRLAARFVNRLMYDGKKGAAEKIFYGALEVLAEKTGEEALRAFEKALENVKPHLEVKARRVGGATYQVPMEVRPDRQVSLSIRWLITYARSRGEKGMSNKLAAEFCLTIFKTIRGYGGAAISATQDLSDFFGLEDGKYGRAIINNSQNKIILNLEPDESKYVQDVLKLTKTELRSITNFDRGEALVYANNNKIPVNIKASDAEKEIITTDRAELEAILNERKKERKKISGKEGEGDAVTG